MKILNVAAPVVLDGPAHFPCTHPTSDSDLPWLFISPSICVLAACEVSLVRTEWGSHRCLVALSRRGFHLVRRMFLKFLRMQARSRGVCEEMPPGQCFESLFVERLIRGLQVLAVAFMCG